MTFDINWPWTILDLGHRSFTSNISTTVKDTTKWNGTLIADADPHNILEPPIDGGYLCSDPISTYYIFTTDD